MSRTFKPTFPSTWTSLCFDPIDLDNLCKVDADLADATWKTFQIWVDAGGETARFVCTLVKILQEGSQPIVLLRDYIDETSDLQIWIDRAVRIAAEIDKEDRSQNEA